MILCQDRVRLTRGEKQKKVVVKPTPPLVLTIAAGNKGVRMTVGKRKKAEKGRV